MTVNYTIPTILQGKIRKSKQAQANERWFVEFYYNHKRIRKSEGLNRIKDYDEKLRAFSELRIKYERELIAGTYSSLKPSRLVIPTISKVIDEFLKYQQDKGRRLKTIQSYSSKLKYLNNAFGEHLVSDIFPYNIDSLLVDLGRNWSPKTYNNAKAIFYNLFEFCVFNRLIESNPVKGLKSKYVPKTDKHRIFSNNDFTCIMQEIKKDRMLDLFVKSIYYTCIRPRELMQLQIKHFDFKRHIIFIPASISKNKKDGWVNICSNYKQELTSFIGINPDFFLFSNDDEIYGDIPYSVNRPYKRFVKILKSLGLNGKGYTLYSFKHYSNVKKYLSGWSLAEIMKANRHSSLEQTEKYLKDLTDFVDISDKTVPKLY